MELGQARDFLRQHHRAVLMTRHRDGSPQLSPVLVALDEDGRAVISTRETATKTHNVRRDHQVALCVFTEAFFGSWIQIDGRAEVVPLPEALDGLVAYYRAINGEHEDWDAYRAAMREQRRVLVRVELTRAGPDRHG
ncbi:TIGR03618 family F420-dependent PPOX class oxidoreductase [Salinifilum aidingensis]